MAEQASKNVAAPGRDGGAFDLEALERSTQGDRALAREVLRLFDEQSDALLGEIAGSAETKARRELAHRLNGAARGVGALAVANAAAEVEKADEPIDAIGALARLSVRVAQAKLALPDLIARY